MQFKSREVLVTAATVAAFGASLALLFGMLRDVPMRALVESFAEIPPPAIAAAIALTVVSYVILTGYDVLALRHVGHRLPYPRVALASFISYAFSHNVGVALLSGGSIRFRIYAAAGLSAGDIAKVVAFCTLTFMFGALITAAAALVAMPDAYTFGVVPAWATSTTAWMALAATAAMILWCSMRRAPIELLSWSLRLPGATMIAAQIALAAADLAVAGGVLWVLLPADAGVPLTVFLGAYVIATAIGVASHVPGGLGVFEAVLLMALPDVPSEQLLGPVLAYRLVYYLMPLGAAALLMGWQEMPAVRRLLDRVDPAVARRLSRISPQILGLAALAAGALLLFSAATPETWERLQFLRRYVPWPLVETSSMLVAAIGMSLVIIARGLFRRLDAAWLLSVALLAAGAVALLLSGFRYEEALVLGGVLAALIPSRRAFYRRASLLHQRFTPGWVVMIVILVVGFLWLGLFSHRPIDYSAETWWRVLRSGLVVVVIAVCFALYRLLRPAPPPAAPAGPDDIERARQIIARSGTADSNLALLRDKRLMFNEEGDAFIMYAVAGRSWIAMGDPVGPPARRSELTWRFREMCDLHDGQPVFYQVTTGCLPLYLDLGLSVVKIGEEGRVPLADFSLDGPERRDLRYGYRRAEREGVRFEIVDLHDDPAMLDQLQAVSDDWLRDKKAREKGFSVGCFRPDYIRQFPCAVIRQEDRIVAFANLWTSAGRHELSIDLMRHVADAPYGVMDFLFVELMLWGKAQGYRWFNLGMVPLSGLENNPLAPAWHQVGAFIFRHGEHFYNFRGLRQYKEKFSPQWRPKFLATPNGLALPRTLIEVTTLISGGRRGDGLAPQPAAQVIAGPFRQRDRAPGPLDAVGTIVPPVMARRHLRP